MRREFFDVKIDNVEMRVAALHRGGLRQPIVLLHGFGSTKEDYADVFRYPEFDGRPIVAFDSPGCGETECSNISDLSISFQVRTAEALLGQLGLKRFHLAGHSMGGLIALMLAHNEPTIPISFSNIEGNIAPEDCFLSRQAVDHTSDSPTDFLRSFIERIRQMPGMSYPFYATNLKNKVRPEAVEPILHSIVDHSDNAELLEKFVELPCPKLFIYGDENRSLSYLNTLEGRGVRLAEIQHSGHFPMYSNPPPLWKLVSGFIDESEME